MTKPTPLPKWADNLIIGSLELFPARLGVNGSRNSPPSIKGEFTFEGERPEAFFTFLAKTGSRPCWCSLAVEGLDTWNPGGAVSLEFGVPPKIKTPADPTGKTIITVKVTFKAEIASNLIRLLEFRAAMIDAGDLETAFLEACPIQANLSEAPKVEAPALPVG